MRIETYENVWDALCDTREEAEAAKRLGMTRPRLNDLTRGKLDKFSLDALVNIATAARDRLAAPGDVDRVARFHPIDEFAQMGLGVRQTDRIHVTFLTI